MSGYLPVHPIARVPRVVCFAEDVVDTSNECGGVLIVVLMAVVGGECELCDAGANVLTGGHTCREAAWLGGLRGKKIR